MDPTFYDRLAPYYHLLYADWEASIERQGAALADLLRDVGVLPGSAVHDAACGIGTQTIALARHGYRMSGSDLSTGAVGRARTELASRGLHAELVVSDMRDLARIVREPVAAVIACDNVVAHLLSDADILDALRSCSDALQPDGALILSVRDYETIPRRSPDVHPHVVHHDGTRRVVPVQVWEWDEDQYDLRLYVTEEHATGACFTHMLCTRYYAVTVTRLMELAREAGLVRVERRDGVLFQPVVIGFREASARRNPFFVR
jgi:SAM-dependent methyltransferase